jgi:hypothetical protein
MINSWKKTGFVMKRPLKKGNQGIGPLARNCRWDILCFVIKKAAVGFLKSWWNQRVNHYSWHSSVILCQLWGLLLLQQFTEVSILWSCQERKSRNRKMKDENEIARMKPMNETNRMIMKMPAWASLHLQACFIFTFHS